jgi:hypothetical protein
MQHEDVMPWKYVGPICSSPEEKLLLHIGGVRIVGGNSHWTLWLTLMIRFTETWLVYQQKSTIYIYMHTYFTTYPPSGVRVFNAARTVLHTLRECIHDVRKRPQDIFRSPRPRCAVVASRTADTQPLPYDRDCPQASLVLRGRVWDSHHPTEEYLPSYPVVGASLQNSKLHKINIESKTGLACHLLRLVLIWASKRILTTVFKNRTARDVLYSDVLYS